MVAPLASRTEQLALLAGLQLDGSPLLIHGSIGHAALMEQPLPGELKQDGQKRDVDVFIAGVGKTALEELASASGLGAPNPIDGGLSDLVVCDGSGFILQKHEVTVPFNGGGIFEEITSYEIPHTNGIVINSFTPLGMLAAHHIEPKPPVRRDHQKEDQQLLAWFEGNDITLPDSIRKSIDEFHRAYREKYPLGDFYTSVSRLYARILPEALRRQLRKHTHRFMRSHAGRISPYA